MTQPEVARPGTTGDASGKPRLSGRLGVGSIVFMVIAAAAPLTVIGGNVPLAIGSGNGAGAPVGFVIAALVLLVFSIGFVTMTPHVKDAGAFYSYVTKGLGGRLGMGTASVALVAYTAIQVGMYGYFGWAIGDLVTHYGGPAIPWWVFALGGVVVVGLLGYRHIELSSKVLGVALVLEIAIVVALDAAIFAKGGADGITGTSFTPDAIGSGPLGIAVLFALTGFIGFEATAVFRDEARDPERTIPRATYLAVGIIGVFYALSCWAIIEGVGASQANAVATTALSNGGNMLLDSAGTYLGTVLRDIMQVLLCTSVFACVLSFHNVIARYQFALAAQGSFPAALGRVHPVQGSPAASSLAQSTTALVFVVVFALVGLDPLVGVFGSMAGVSTVGMVLLMLLTSVAVFAFFQRDPQARRGRVMTTVVAPIAAVVGLVASLWLVISNFTLVTGGSVGVSVFLALIPVVALVAGVLIGASRAGRSGSTPAAAR
ncbi:APC family permease [Actinokineospora globicatena]|uniref:APC family permease n=1 Tax=Actinokineospora globicatena TaxID=103729 RepID=UPI0020A390F7|nr:APC family permease [Actinokineospora globicatena]MCP2306738.1 amino acid/polyamine/organocation transporter, APC superfamily (TC 2.A.3) [Actinokineospora globicatena]GLW82144.1 putative amino acid permease [Actinokineospora globicatena]GLW88937.1 putative amino acid permease [Actinokineospora globicatena]